MRRIVLALALSALATTAVHAQGADKPKEDKKQLTLGDRVTPLDIAHYFSGEPVTTFDKEKVYVVEFWATW